MIENPKEFVIKMTEYNPEFASDLVDLIITTISLKGNDQIERQRQIALCEALAEQTVNASHNKEIKPYLECIRS
jgi:hypothetical protein